MTLMEESDWSTDDDLADQDATASGPAEAEHSAPAASAADPKAAVFAAVDAILAGNSHASVPNAAVQGAVPAQPAAEYRSAPAKHAKHDSRHAAVTAADSGIHASEPAAADVLAAVDQIVGRANGGAATPAGVHTKSARASTQQTATAKQAHAAAASTNRGRQSMVKKAAGGKKRKAGVPKPAATAAAPRASHVDASAVLAAVDAILGGATPAAPAVASQGTSNAATSPAAAHQTIGQSVATTAEAALSQQSAQHQPTGSAQHSHKPTQDAPARPVDSDASATEDEAAAEDEDDRISGISRISSDAEISDSDAVDPPTLLRAASFSSTAGAAVGHKRTAASQKPRASKKPAHTPWIGSGTAADVLAAVDAIVGNTTVEDIVRGGEVAKVESQVGRPSRPRKRKKSPPPVFHRTPHTAAAAARRSYRMTARKQAAAEAAGVPRQPPAQLPPSPALITQLFGADAAWEDLKSTAASPPQSPHSQRVQEGDIDDPRAQQQQQPAGPADVLAQPAALQPANSTAEAAAAAAARQANLASLPVVAHDPAQPGRPGDTATAEAPSASEAGAAALTGSQAPAAALGAASAEALPVPATEADVLPGRMRIDRPHPAGRDFITVHGIRLPIPQFYDVLAVQGRVPSLADIAIEPQLLQGPANLETLASIVAQRASGPRPYTLRPAPAEPAAAAAQHARAGATEGYGPHKAYGKFAGLVAEPQELTAWHIQLLQQFRIGGPGAKANKGP